MKTVNWYSVQVKYSGDFTDYTKEQLFEKAQAKVYKGVDPFDHSSRYSDEMAKELDGYIEADDTYPCNKIATVKWCYIDEETDERRNYYD